ncbi:zeta toxin family protein [Rhizorhabdus sp. FW153]|uniref:zeta toxin family protein n=1 Tax=Rhizorhabdus sp. FW153 TaxID=3400216 RepID=UPI003CEB1F3F
MTALSEAIDQILVAQRQTEKPLAIVLAGHNGSGKSTMWRKVLADRLQIPLINADRLMLSILPEPNSDGALPDWAQGLRDSNEGWMRVSQQGVHAFVGHAMAQNVPFAMETVFSYWDVSADGTVSSKIDMIREMQDAGYFVLILFVGLSNVELSILRVQTRVAEHGHDVPHDRLLRRFPKTQNAIREAVTVADAAVLADNSRTTKEAFTVSRVQIGTQVVFDIRQNGAAPPMIAEWLDVVVPLVG